MFGGGAAFALFDVELRAVPGLLVVFMEPAVDRVTLAGLASLAVIPLDGAPLAGEAFAFFAGGTIPNAGNVSSSSPASSSSDESTANRFEFGVLRG